MPRQDSWLLAVAAGSKEGVHIRRFTVQCGGAASNEFWKRRLLANSLTGGSIHLVYQSSSELCVFLAPDVGNVPSTIL